MTHRLRATTTATHTGGGKRRESDTATPCHATAGEGPPEWQSVENYSSTTRVHDGAIRV